MSTATDERTETLEMKAPIDPKSETTEELQIITARLCMILGKALLGHDVTSFNRAEIGVFLLKINSLLATLQEIDRR